MKILPMATPKFKIKYEEMIKKNKELFDTLKNADPKSEEFRDAQNKAMRVIRKSEDSLCAKTENAHYGNFSTNLADKFWEEIRSNYPEIDY